MSTYPFSAFAFAGDPSKTAQDENGKPASVLVGRYFTIDDAFEKLEAYGYGGYVLDTDSGEWRGSAGPPG